ncbi:transcriptional repressor [Stenotrophomonas sp. S39]|nr:transcriptional repressor [Stenotrophomonas sp. S39]
MRKKDDPRSADEAQIKGSPVKSTSPQSIAGNLAVPQRDGVELKIEAISSICDKRGVRLTQARRRVLRMLVTATGPLKAYTILEAVRRESPNTAPTAVYRVLEFLRRNGWAIKLNSINAFLLRPAGPPWSCTFLVCENCGSVETIHVPVLPAGFLDDLHVHGFTPASHALEISGTCSACRNLQAQEDGTDQ